MKTRLLFHRPGRSLKGTLVSITMALLLAAALFMASVFLSPPVAPAQALVAPTAAALQAPASKEINGTLASFTALYPELLTAYLPIITH